MSDLFARRRDAYIAELDALKAANKKRGVDKEGRKRKLAGETLRERDPW